MTLKTLFNLCVELLPSDNNFAELATNNTVDKIHIIFSNPYTKDCQVILFKDHQVVGKERISVMGAPSKDPRKQILKDIKSWAKTQG